MRFPVNGETYAPISHAEAILRRIVTGEALYVAVACCSVVFKSRHDTTIHRWIKVPSLPLGNRRPPDL